MDAAVDGDAGWTQVVVAAVAVGAVPVLPAVVRGEQVAQRGEADLSLAADRLTGG